MILYQVDCESFGKPFFHWSWPSHVIGTVHFSKSYVIDRHHNINFNFFSLLCNKQFRSLSNLLSVNDFFLQNVRNLFRLLYRHVLLSENADCSYFITSRSVPIIYNLFNRFEAHDWGYLETFSTQMIVHCLMHSGCNSTIIFFSDNIIWKIKQTCFSMIKDLFLTYKK